MKALLNPLRMLLLAGLLGTAATGFVLIPPGTTLPIHWGPSGGADGFAPRELALLMPLAMAALVWGLYVFLPRLARPGDMEAGKRPLGVVLTAITALALLLEVATVLVGLGVGVNVVQAIALAMGVLLIVLGNAMPKSQPNSVAGIRIPSTLGDAANWQATHRLTGVLAIAGGAVLFVAALLVPTPVLIWWLLGCIFVPIAIGVGYSLVLAGRARRA
ncbi:MAG: SdpI family protein [Devosia sp.]